MPSTLQDRVAGISTSVAVKAPVRVATTANITLSGLQAIDGVTVVANDRVLVKNQTTQTENGIYVADTSNWARAEDFDGAGDAVKGTRVWIIEGSTLAGTEWNLTTANTVDIGTDNIVFAQSPLQDAVDAAEAAQAAAEAAAAGVNLPSISGGDAGKPLVVNGGEDAFELGSGALGTAAFLNVGTGASNIVQRDGSGNYPAGDGAAITGVIANFPRGHLWGLTLSNGTDADHDIDIAVGECRDGSNAYNMTLSAVMTKQIDASWTAGDDAGGLFSGSVANNTWYHVFLIRKDSDGTIDAGFDTSVSAANIPAGYTAYRRLGAVRTDGSANILPFTQRGDTFELTTHVQDYDATGPGTSAVTVVLDYVPTGIVVQADIFVKAENDATQESIYVTALTATDQAPSSTAGPAFRDSTGSSQGQTGPFLVWTNASAQIRYRIESSSGNATVDIWVRGWVDTRGRLA